MIGKLVTPSKGARATFVLNERGTFKEWSRTIYPGDLFLVVDRIDSRLLGDLPHLSYQTDFVKVLGVEGNVSYTLTANLEEHTICHKR